jgi:23S rRNA (pseudouridine1915-N3)-methyltransferase
MKITLLQISKTDDKHLSALIDMYESRLKHYISFNTITIPELKNTKSLSAEEIKKREGELIFKYISHSNPLLRGDRGVCFILLDDHGKETTSKEFAAYLQQQMNHSVKEICFIIGGAYGVSDEVKKTANFKLSLSKMTFTHQLSRLLFIEQLYRAFTIIRNESYHNE